MKIIKIQESDKKIGLSIKAVKQEEYQQDLQAYREQAVSSSTTLSEAFKAAQAAAREKAEE
jgi:predicted RNA-binding protein with RPS1 domain